MLSQYLGFIFPLSPHFIIHTFKMCIKWVETPFQTAARRMTALQKAWRIKKEKFAFWSTLQDTFCLQLKLKSFFCDLILFIKERLSFSFSASVLVVSQGGTRGLLAAFDTLFTIKVLLVKSDLHKIFQPSTGQGSLAYYSRSVSTFLQPQFQT